jgi:hypothetical protein
MTKTAAYLNEIKRRSEEIWGDKWQPQLIKRYVELLQQSGDTEATYERKRTQMYKVFQQQACTLENLILLAEAVGCSFEMSCTKVEKFRA